MSTPRPTGAFDRCEPGLGLGGRHPSPCTAPCAVPEMRPFGKLRVTPSRVEGRQRRIQGLIITHIVQPPSTERAFGGSKAGIVHEGLAGQQAHLECGALGAISIALQSPDEIGASSPAFESGGKLVLSEAERTAALHKALAARVALSLSSAPAAVVSRDMWVMVSFQGEDVGEGRRPRRGPSTSRLVGSPPTPDQTRSRPVRHRERRMQPLPGRTSFFMVIAVHHARLPFGRIWLVIPSAFLFGFAAVGWIVLRSSRRLDAKLRRSTPFDARRVSRRLIQCSEALLCSGSYTLAEVRLPAEGVKVMIRVI